MYTSKIGQKSKRFAQINIIPVIKVINSKKKILNNTNISKKFEIK